MVNNNPLAELRKRNVAKNAEGVAEEIGTKQPDNITSNITNGAMVLNFTLD